jgi:hypothetical protein
MRSKPNSSSPQSTMNGLFISLPHSGSRGAVTSAETTPRRAAVEHDLRRHGVATDRRIHAARRQPFQAIQEFISCGGDAGS